MKRKVLFTFGRPFSPVYSMAMRIRELCYKKGIFRTTSFAVPVVSVGNLTMGGTGKTPLVKYMAARFLERGYKPAIISRGYGGATRERVNLVSDGQTVLLDAAFAGDEPCMLAHSLPGVPVLTGVVRRLPAARAIEMGADLLILDDGFQHLAIERDVDLVLFNAQELAGNSRVFPGGDLREPIRALLRCHAFVLTGINTKNSARADKFSALLATKFPERPVFRVENKVVRLCCRQPDGSENQVVTTELVSHRCFAFCGIARPQGFKETLEQHGMPLVGFEALADHHHYQEKVVRHLENQARKTGASCFVCTEKDLVKLRHFSLSLPLYAVIMEDLTNDDLINFVCSQLPAKTHITASST